VATQSLRRGAFARAVKATGDVVVDLSQLVFADASLTFDLAILAQRLRKQGRRLLLRDPQPQIAKLFALVGLIAQPGVLAV
jgi:anti-anti-sigma regulatory factor